MVFGGNKDKNNNNVGNNNVSYPPPNLTNILGQYKIEYGKLFRQQDGSYCMTVYNARYDYAKFIFSFPNKRLQIYLYLGKDLNKLRCFGTYATKEEEKYISRYLESIMKRYEHFIFYHEWDYKLLSSNIAKLGGELSVFPPDKDETIIYDPLLNKGYRVVGNSQIELLNKDLKGLSFLVKDTFKIRPKQVISIARNTKNKKLKEMEIIIIF